MNALSPAPVIIIHLVLSFSILKLIAFAISSKVLMFNAFRFLGRLIEMVVILFFVLIVNFQIP
ncbi:MAG: hypothetical protein CM15mP121_0250 [Bacteroidota bacterium]|nr:MAG: hypothetical protein CM15mP121_0250 [Bacteroidota bacterium]